MSEEGREGGNAGKRDAGRGGLREVASEYGIALVSRVACGIVSEGVSDGVRYP